MHINGNCWCTLICSCAARDTHRSGVKRCLRAASLFFQCCWHVGGEQRAAWRFNHSRVELVISFPSACVASSDWLIARAGSAEAELSQSTNESLIIITALQESCVDAKCTRCRLDVLAQREKDVSKSFHGKFVDRLDMCLRDK